MREALNLSIQDKSIKKSRSVVEVALDPEFDTICSYQRLESKRCNPSLKSLSDFSVEYA
jgi:hypothetical protein